MKAKTKVLIAAATVTVAAGIALATPLINLTSPVVAAGSVPDSVNVYGSTKALSGGEYHVYLTTQGASTISSQIGSYKAAGENGWHSHPGMVTVTLTQGSITWYNANCEPTVYNAGDAWVEGSQVHMFRVLGKETVVVYATFITAEGEALRTDQPAPPCAAALGLT